MCVFVCVCVCVCVSVCVKTKYETLNFSAEKSPTFWILPKLYELCKFCRRNSLEIF